MLLVSRYDKQYQWSVGFRRGSIHIYRVPSLSLLNSTKCYFITFSLDCFAVIIFPFAYPQYSRTVMTVICTLSWLISLLTNLVPIPQWLDCYGLYKNTNSCVLVLDCSSMFLKLWSYLVGVLRSFIAVGFFCSHYINKGRV